MNGPWRALILTLIVMIVVRIEWGAYPSAGASVAMLFALLAVELFVGLVARLLRL